MNVSSRVAEVQGVWDALLANDFDTVLDSQTDGVIYDNGPGAGPWDHVEGKESFIEMAAQFIPLFGDTLRQVGTCIFANEQFAVTLVAETGNHAVSGDVFDNRAVYVSRFDKDGKTERVWTVDLDSEDMLRFWQRNSVGVVE